MYGQATSSAAGATLAATGVTSGSMVLMAIGLMFLGGALVTVVSMAKNRHAPRP
jgi:hypothetical protein